MQCSVGKNPPVLLCSLLPEKSESCSLDLEFEEEDDEVVFSVVGPRSVHLTGYFINESSQHDGDDGDRYSSFSMNIFVCSSFLKKNFAVGLMKRICGRWEVMVVKNLEKISRVQVMKISTCLPTGPTVEVLFGSC